MELVNKMDNINDVFNNADLYTKEVFKIFKHNKELYELDEISDFIFVIFIFVFLYSSNVLLKSFV